MVKAKKYGWVLLLLLACQCMVSAAVWTVSPWTDDASTGIDSSKTYTHAINISNDGSVVPNVNGVQFTNEWNVPTSWSLNGGGYIDNDNGNNISGDSYGISTRFRYGNSLLTLTGLTPGTVYELTLFSVAWEDGTRTVTLKDVYGSFVFNQDMYGNNNGIKIVGLYTADANGQLKLGVVNDFHIYGFANCVYTGDLPVVVSPLSPANFDGGTTVGLDTVLTWAEEFAGSLASPMFDVYMDPNETKVTTLDPAVRLSTGQTAFTFDPELNWETLYYWRVVTYINGEPNMATTIRSFKTDFEVDHWSDSSWTSDADSGISVGKVYTHKVNINASEGVSTTVNGVAFENDNNRVGTNWNLTAAAAGAGNGSYMVTGDGGALISNFFYGADPNPTLTLTGLTAGQDYVLTLYTRAWGTPGTRVINVTTSADGRTVALDENIDGETMVGTVSKGNGHLFKYAYTAPASGSLAVTFDAQTADSWHHYAFSNEIAVPVYLNPTPMPGSNVDADVVLSWVLNGEAVNPTYTLKVATNPAMSNPIVDLSNLTATSYDPVLDSDMTYYWQVQVVEAGNVIYTSPVWNFKTTPPPDAVKVIEWKLDETTGTIANQTGPSDDAVGILKGFKDPNAPGVSHVAGLVNNGLYLDGTEEYVDVSNASPYMPTALNQDFSVSLYFRTFKAFGPLFSMRHSELDNPLVDFTLGRDGVQYEPGKVCMIVRDDPGSIGYTNSGITVNDGRWHNLIVTRAGGNWTMYIDGVKRGTLNGVAAGDVTLDWLALGSSLRWISTNWSPQYYYSRYFQGILDEYTIWEGELSPKQIKALAAIVPGQGDIDFDMDTDIDDLKDLAAVWLDNSATPVQSLVVLENMEAYTNDPNTYQDYLAYADEPGSFGLLDLSIETDDVYGQVLRVDYNFDGHPHAHIPVRLIEKRLNSSLYDTFITRIKKPADCEINALILDYYDGVGHDDPITEGLYSRGRIIIDISAIAKDEWVTLEVPIVDTADFGFSSTTDLYQVMYSIQDGGADVGTLFIDSIELSDTTTNCVPVVGQNVPDMNGDCIVNLLDFEEIAENWMAGL
ncbi:MAG: LamG domain-containing protein [Anaerohalosphaeraceae bacterium]